MADNKAKIVGADLYEALGRAIGQWQHVEIGLYHVFQRVTQMPNNLISSAVFFSPVSFDAKLAMVDSAAQFALADSEYLEQWNTLRNKLVNKKGRRNELAHFMSIHHMNVDEPDVLQSQLQPNIFNAKAALHWKRKGKLPKYSPDQLTEISRSFGRLAQKLEDFARALAELKLPSPEKFPL